MTAEQSYERMTGPVHEYFGLSYSTHDVIARALAQSMPIEWQERYAQVRRELDAAFINEDLPEYKVQAGQWHALDWDHDLTRQAGWKVEHGEHETTYYGPHGQEVSSDEADIYRVFIPMYDDLADYRNTYIAPDEDALRAFVTSEANR